MPSPPRTVDVDITGRLALDGRHHISTSVFPPDRPSPERSTPLLWCLPGGTYTKAYWHLNVPGHPGYSFAEYFADRGVLVVAVDHVGTGDSSRHPHAAQLLPHVVAEANALAFDEVRARAERGELLPGIGPLAIGPTVGVGHSMGAMLAIIQQSRHDSFDAVAALGYGNIGTIVSLPGADDNYRASAEDVMQMANAGLFDEPFLADRTIPELRHHFYEDVPDAVIAADDLSNTHLPGVTGLLSVVPFIVADHAARLRCPVFIGLGERDSTPNHHDEARAYGASTDITLFILGGSAHCHNSANTRHMLWSRLEHWLRGLATTHAPSPAGPAHPIADT